LIFNVKKREQNTGGHTNNRRRARRSVRLTRAVQWRIPGHVRTRLLPAVSAAAAGIHVPERIHRTKVKLRARSSSQLHIVICMHYTLLFFFLVRMQCMLSLINHSMSSDPQPTMTRLEKNAGVFYLLVVFLSFFYINETHTVLRGSFKKNYLPKSIMQRCFARILSLSLTLSRSVSYQSFHCESDLPNFDEVNKKLY
jgi:hypothetical protein